MKASQPAAWQQPTRCYDCGKAMAIADFTCWLCLCEYCHRHSHAVCGRWICTRCVVACWCLVAFLALAGGMAWLR